MGNGKGFELWRLVWDEEARESQTRYLRGGIGSPCCLDVVTEGRGIGEDDSQACEGGVWATGKQ